MKNLQMKMKDFQMKKKNISCDFLEKALSKHYYHQYNNQKLIIYHLIQLQSHCDPKNKLRAYS